jgi:hypothetical protein
MVAVCNVEGWLLHFLRPFGPAKMVEWDNLMRELHLSVPSKDDDVISWRIEASKGYSTRSMYLRISQGAAITHFKEVLRTRVPPMIKIFLYKFI